ncbi:MAG: prephenate dehydratase [Acidobacteria bacterium RIFCSPLOWO2_02_FULL_59_13]|nr:MAG: prephenate dehydratase [Acidobacteria bacterium RIFCSPLOWO2_02_FULL_59_13]
MKHARRVGFQGERGAFSEVAAQKLVPDPPQPMELVPLPSFPDLFRALAAGKIDYAVVPIENTLAGSVHENYDLLLKYRLPILLETRVRIVHNLIAPRGVSLRSVRRVYSHPVALRQCLRFLDRHRRWEVVPFYDTAGSVKMLMEKQVTDAAAIASANAASLYHARILARDIGDDRQNYTRFFLLGSRAKARANRSGVKTSIVFTTGNLPGALFRCLSVFALRDINLTKIESRPLVGRPWEYLFYLDFLGNPRTPKCRNALKNLEEITEFLRVLGCYSTVA